jgi:hypothetical protein
MRKWPLILATAWLLPICQARATEHKAPNDDGEHKELKKQKEEKGALRERTDPAKDRKVQEANVARLEHNAKVERANGNRIGAWAAEQDAKHARKLLNKDEALLRANEGKTKVEGKTTRE